MLDQGFSYFYILSLDLRIVYHIYSPPSTLFSNFFLIFLIIFFIIFMIHYSPLPSLIHFPYLPRPRRGHRVVNKHPLPKVVGSHHPYRVVANVVRRSKILIKLKTDACVGVKEDGG